MLIDAARRAGDRGQHRSQAVTFLANSTDALEDQLLVVVLGGDVVAALEHDPLDRAAVVLGEVVPLRRRHHVVLRRGEDQQRHRASSGTPRRASGDASISDSIARDRRAVVGALGDVGVGDVAADAGHHLDAAVEHPCIIVAPSPPAERRGGRVDADEPGDLRVVGADPQRERAAHAQPGDDDLVGAGGEALVGGLGLGDVVGPARSAPCPRRRCRGPAAAASRRGTRRRRTPRPARASTTGCP